MYLNISFNKLHVLSLSLIVLFAYENIWFEATKQCSLTFKPGLTTFLTFLSMYDSALSTIAFCSDLPYA